MVSIILLENFGLGRVEVKSRLSVSSKNIQRAYNPFLVESSQNPEKLFLFLSHSSSKNGNKNSNLSVFAIDQNLKSIEFAGKTLLKEISIPLRFGSLGEETIGIDSKGVLMKIEC